MRSRLVVGVASMALGLGYFGFHWAYGAWAYQRGHARLIEQYSIFLKKHKDRLDWLLEHSGKRGCEVCDRIRKASPDYFVVDWGREVSLLNRRITLLQSEISWQDRLAGPWRERPIPKWPFAGFGPHGRRPNTGVPPHGTGGFGPAPRGATMGGPPKGFPGLKPAGPSGGKGRLP